MDALEKYVHEFSEPEEELLHELDRETNLRAVAPRMLSGHIQGRLLEMLVQMMRPRRVLEIGTFTGYSALSMAAGLDEGAELHTVEVDDEQEEFIRSYFARSPHGDKITLHIGSALEIAPKLGGEFDMVFIDGDKRESPTTFSGRGKSCNPLRTTTATRRRSWSSTAWSSKTRAWRTSSSRCATD